MTISITRHAAIRSPADIAVDAGIQARHPHLGRAQLVFIQELGRQRVAYRAWPDLRLLSNSIGMTIGAVQHWWSIGDLRGAAERERERWQEQEASRLLRSGATCADCIESGEWDRLSPTVQDRLQQRDIETATAGIARLRARAAGSKG